MTHDVLTTNAVPPPRPRTRWRRRWAPALAFLTALLIATGVQAPPSSAADAIFANGPVPDLIAGGVFGPWVNLTKIGVRSLDGHSSCWRAYDGVSFTNTYCVNDLGSSAYGAVYRTPHCYSGWTGHDVQMRCREYW